MKSKSVLYLTITILVLLVIIAVVQFNSITRSKETIVRQQHSLDSLVDLHAKLDAQVRQQQDQLRLWEMECARLRAESLESK
jgi:biopolymer transport protein ExbB/TolQ